MENIDILRKEILESIVDNEKIMDCIERNDIELYTHLIMLVTVKLDPNIYITKVNDLWAIALKK